MVHDWRTDLERKAELQAEESADRTSLSTLGSTGVQVQRRRLSQLAQVRVSSPQVYSQASFQDLYNTVASPKMVRIDLGGKPLINIDTANGKVDIPQMKQQIRQRMRGGGRSVHLSWNTSVPRIVLTSDTEDFDPTIISHFLDEGFQLSYLEYDGNKADYLAKLQHLQDPLELGEKYAIVGK